MKIIVKKIISVLLLIIFFIDPLIQMAFNSGVKAANEENSDNVYQQGRYVYGDDINDIKWHYNADREEYELVNSEVVYYLEFNATVKSDYRNYFFNEKNKGAYYYAESDNRLDNTLSTDPQRSSYVKMYIIDAKDDNTRKNGIEITLRGRYYSKKYSASEVPPTDVITLKIDDPSGATFTQRVKADVKVSYKKYTWLVWPKGSKKPGTKKYESVSSSSNTSSIRYTEEEEKEIEEIAPKIHFSSYDSRYLFIRDLYKRALLREPSYDELNYWYRNHSIPEIATGIMLSAEADEKSYANYLTYSDFVEYCYNVILGRAADTSAKENYTKVLDNGSLTKKQLIWRLMNSDEFLNYRNKSVKSIGFQDKNLCYAVYNEILKQDKCVVRYTETVLLMYEDEIQDVKTLDISGKEITRLNGLQYFENLTRLLAQNNSITSLEGIRNLPLKYLNLSNNKVSYDSTTSSIIGDIKNIKTLEELYMDNIGVKNFNIELPNLKVLSLNNDELQTLPDLSKLNSLKELYLDSNKISDITGVENVKLNKFSIKNNIVTIRKSVEREVDLPSIITNTKNSTSKVYTNKALKCENCTEENNKLVLSQGKKRGTITINGGNADGTSVTYYTQSCELTFEDEVLANKIENAIGKLVISRTEENGRIVLKVNSQALEEIVDLDLSGKPNEKITNLNGLEQFRYLKSLDLSGNDITDFSVLGQLDWLETLQVRNCNLSDLNLLNNFRTGNGLSNLDASCNRITDISGVEKTPKLSTLYLSANNVQNNLDSLKKLTNLNELYIAGNNITDISAIKDLELYVLNCSNNQIANDNLTSFADKVTAYNNKKTIVTNDNGSVIVPSEVEEILTLGNDNIELINCTIQNHLITLDEGQIKGKVIIKGGNYSKSIININAPIDTTPPEIEVSYRKNTETNQIEVVITSNEELQDLAFFKRSEDKKTLVKSYGYNTSERVYISDLAGNQTPADINITQFSNNRIPGFKVTVNNTNFKDNITNENIVVTISADVPLHKPDYGDYWTISEDGKTLTQSFDRSTVLYQTIYSQADYELDRELRPRYLNGETDLLEQLNEIESRRIDVRLDIPNIDKTAPQCDIEYSTTETTAGSVRVTIWSDEKIKLSDTSGWDSTETIKIDDNGRKLYGLVLIFDSNRKVQLSVLDMANNATTINIDVNNIDKIITGFVKSQINAIVSNQNTSITLSADENISILDNRTTSSSRLNTRIADNYELNTQHQLEYTLEENGTGTLDIEDDAGNIDNILYAVNTIDKQAPVVDREEDIINNDGSKTVTYWINEKLSNIEELNGWTYDEEKSTISKTFNKNTSELLKIRDLAGNESEEVVWVDGVNKVSYEVKLQYYQKLNQYLVTITADTKLIKVDGWNISDDEKSLSKYMNPDEEEIVFIEDYEGNGSEVDIKLQTTDEEIMPNIKTQDDETDREDTTMADEVIPQTGNNPFIIITVGLTLVGLTVISLKNYLKNN